MEYNRVSKQKMMGDEFGDVYKNQIIKIFLYNETSLQR